MCLNFNNMALYNALVRVCGKSCVVRVLMLAVCGEVLGLVICGEGPNVSHLW